MYSAVQAQEPAGDEIDPTTRGVMYATLFGIVLLGLLLLVIIRIGAHRLRRKAKLGRGPSRMTPQQWQASRAEGLLREREAAARQTKRKEG
jgi:hypothetical protein